MLDQRDPEDLGFSRRRLERAGDLLCSLVEKGLVPGAEILVARRGFKALHRACGLAEVVPSRRPLRAGMLFDLASLTKALSGSLVTGSLVSEGLVHLKQRVSEIVPEFSRTAGGVSEAKERIRVWMLLSHSSGLPPWAPLYRAAESRRDVVGEALRSFPAFEPASGALYSDLGYIVLTEVLERASGERLDALFEKLVARPLGLSSTLYNPLGRGVDPQSVVSTEVVGGRPLTGVVHDENARAMEGVSAHAGLFSTAEEIAILATEILLAHRGSSDRLVAPAYARAMLSEWACGDRRYGLGWWIYDVRSTEAGGDLFANARGHTGFTGTSLWIDLDLELAVVLLTNRVHPSRDSGGIEILRPLAHNAVLSSLRA